jgi:hypothetical protein
MPFSGLVALCKSAHIPVFRPFFPVLSPFANGKTIAVGCGNYVSLGHKKPGAVPGHFWIQAQILDAAFSYNVWCPWSLMGRRIGVLNTSGTKAALSRLFCA